MNNYQHVYLISDIHGYIEGIKSASAVSTVDAPLFILGDLFGHQYGIENQIIDLILQLCNEDRCKIIMGNHDEVLYIIFFRFKDNQTIIAELAHPGFEVITETLKTIFSIDFYHQYETIRTNLLTSQLDDNIRIAEYYKQVEQLVIEQGKQERLSKLYTLFEQSTIFAQFKVGQTKFFVSHSGSDDCVYGLNVLKPDYRLPNGCDYGIMGHVTTTHLSRSLDNLPGSLPLGNFISNHSIEGIGITGNYVYNQHSKTLMIDDGLHSNIVILEIK